MKKILVIGIISGMCFFVFLTSCTRQMERRNNKAKAEASDGVNKTEGYFYHQAEQSRESDSTKIKKNINN